ncbi:MAG: tRNA (N(6)-L-threonylcarbamoyladenosine(37)-C(2))-methylthiotransferase MtaB [Treponema sp.]|nr:tRNA (N(6)-L-threonylcarbamoyladenosine(37)-C(2))-methylthiotransferase MtaB [Treponema sp.]
MFFSVYTLGCKLNQLESEAIADSLCRHGFTYLKHLSENDSEPRSEAGNDPDLVVVNTCTVTSMADQKARRIIRKMLRDYPRSCLVVTGCYAQLEKEALSALEEDESGRLFIVPGQKKDSIMDLGRFLSLSLHDPGCGQNSIGTALPDLISSWLSAGAFGSGSGQITQIRYAEGEGGAFRFNPGSFSSHSRSFLKIQDGCDHFCAYCRVRIARGKSQSLGSREILKRLKTLEQQGFAEAVLTGVNISQYRDTELEFPGLGGLLDFLLRETSTIRFRLSSIEPDMFTLESDVLTLKKYSSDIFFRVLENHRIRPHFHLSLQSGSTAILAKMGRTYTPDDAERAVAVFRSIRQDPFLACDIITGFPGETEQEFEKTAELCERIGFSWIHAFPFSPRPGTAACDFPGKVSQREATKRVEILSELARKGRRNYIWLWDGKEVEAVAEVAGSNTARRKLPEGFFPAVSENYLKLIVDSGGKPIPPPGSLLRCRISVGEVPGNEDLPVLSQFDAHAAITG